MDMMGLGFQQAGFDVVASNEIDPVICRTLQRNFKHDVINTSVHRLSIEDIRKDYGQLRGIIGGFPCTAYSRIADVNGTRLVHHQTSDQPHQDHGPRAKQFPDYSKYAALGGDLSLHFFRIVANLQPDFFVIENVPGLLGARIVRETFANMPCGRSTMGYYYKLFEGILNARDFGLPQNRPRYFFVGSVKGGSLDLERPLDSHHLVVGDVLEDNPEMEIPDYVYNRLNGGYRDRPIVTEAGPFSVAPTVMAHYGKDRSTRLVKIGETVRPYTVREMARLQGVPDSVEIEGSEFYQYLQVGNTVPVPVARAIGCGVRRLLN